MTFREARRECDVSVTVGVHDQHVGVCHAGAYSEANPAECCRSAQREENVASAILSRELGYVQHETDTAADTILADLSLRKGSCDDISYRCGSAGAQSHTEA